MRYFVDTEFCFDAKQCSVAPISIGIVADDGREFYACNANWWDGAIDIPAFIVEQVIPALDDPDQVLFVHGEWGTVARDLLTFIGDDTPEFWGDYAAFDYVVLSIIMGGFDAWPNGWPMHINDLQQDAVPSLPSKVPHNALHDARAVRDSYYAAFIVGGEEQPEGFPNPGAGFCRGLSKP